MLGEQPVKGLIESSLLLFKQPLPAGQDAFLVFSPGITGGQAGPKSDEQKLVGFRKIILICFSHFFVLPGFGYLAESLLITKPFRRGRIVWFGVILCLLTTKRFRPGKGKIIDFKSLAQCLRVLLQEECGFLLGLVYTYNANGLPNLSGLLELAAGGESQSLLGWRRGLLWTP